MIQFVRDLWLNHLIIANTCSLEKDRYDCWIDWVVNGEQYLSIWNLTVVLLVWIASGAQVPQTHYVHLM
jgi:hypothetical protein